MKTLMKNAMLFWDGTKSARIAALIPIMSKFAMMVVQPFPVVWFRSIVAAIFLFKKQKDDLKDLAKFRRFGLMSFLYYLNPTLLTFSIALMGSVLFPTWIYCMAPLFSWWLTGQISLNRTQKIALMFGGLSVFGMTFGSIKTSIVVLENGSYISFFGGFLMGIFAVLSMVGYTILLNKDREKSIDSGEKYNPVDVGDSVAFYGACIFSILALPYILFFGVLKNVDITPSKIVVVILAIMILGTVCTRGFIVTHVSTIKKYGKDIALTFGLTMAGIGVVYSVIFQNLFGKIMWSLFEFSFIKEPVSLFGWFCITVLLGSIFVCYSEIAKQQQN